MSSNMASERSALVNPSSSFWSMIFSNPSIKKSKLLLFCLTSARPLSNLHKGSSNECQIQSETDSLQMTLLFILPSQHLPNQRFSRKILTTLNAGVINGTWNLTPLISKCQVIHITRSKNPIPTQYTLHNCILESVFSENCNGVNISSDL